MPRDPSTRPRLLSETRRKIFDIIGWECALAGEECSGPLEVDHMYGRDWVPRKKGSYERNRRYLKEAKDGLVRALCRYHNETVRPNKGAKPSGKEPF